MGNRYNEKKAAREEEAGKEYARMFVYVCVRACVCECIFFNK